MNGVVGKEGKAMSSELFSNYYATDLKKIHCVSFIDIRVSLAKVKYFRLLLIVLFAQVNLTLQAFDL